MAKIIINVPRFKGEYRLDFDDEPFTAQEWRWIKKISGYLPYTINEGWRGGDPDLFVAFAVVAMHRSGKIRREEALAAADMLIDQPFDGTALQFDFTDDEEVDVDPPAVPAETPENVKPLTATGGPLRQT